MSKDNITKPKDAVISTPEIIGRKKHNLNNLSDEDTVVVNPAAVDEDGRVVVRKKNYPEGIVESDDSLFDDIRKEPDFDLKKIEELLQKNNSLNSGSVSSSSSSVFPFLERTPENFRKK